MNVKTAHKGYPKDELMAEVGEIKGKTPEAKAQRAQKRGKHAAFRQDFKVAGDRQVTVVAAGHNKKVPLLLVGTHSSLLPGEDHKKVWHVNLPDGTTQYYSKVTPQPEMHMLYRKHMNHVDLHNKLRQGVVSMADVWQTTSWVERHFAEGIGMWEVNVYKALLYFQKKKWESLSHSDFRARLAHSLMTLGKAEFPSDAPSEQQRARTPAFTSPPNTMNCPPPEPEQPAHRWIYDRNLCKRCSYCGKNCHSYCKTCEDAGIGRFFACKQPHAWLHGGTCTRRESEALLLHKEKQAKWLLQQHLERERERGRHSRWWGASRVAEQSMAAPTTCRCPRACCEFEDRN